MFKNNGTFNKYEKFELKSLYNMKLFFFVNKINLTHLNLQKI